MFGFNTLRTWAFSAMDVDRQKLQTRPGVYNERIFRGLDFLLGKTHQLSDTNDNGKTHQRLYAAGVWRRTGIVVVHRILVKRDARVKTVNWHHRICYELYLY